MKMQNTKCNTQYGFTFMELLIAFTIFSIIAASIYYTLGAGIKVYKRGNTMIRDNQELRIFFNTISRDLRNAVPYNIESDSKKKSEFRTTEALNFEIESEWSIDRISFPTLIDVFSEDSVHAELARVSYYIDKKGRDGKRLIRKCASVKEGFNEEFAEGEGLLDDLEDFVLEDFSLEYCYKVPSIGFEDEFDWRSEEFDEEGIPRGVRITLTLKNKAKKTEETFVETVFIPRGSLGSDIE